MNVITEILAWTLLHSFWIALIAWIISQGANLVFKKSAPKLAIKSLTAISFLFATILVAWAQIPKVDEPEITWAIFENQILMDRQLSWIDSFKLIISKNSIWISLFWLAGCIVGSLQVIRQKQDLNRISQNSQPVALMQIQQLFEDIKNRLGIKAKVRLLANDLILSPMTIGFLKPAIFIPAGIVTGFSQEELEAILYHELAHIRRKDYLINLFLVGLETIFFFNPIVKLLVKDLRNEMEYASDDVVLENQNEMTYARTLIKLQEFNLKNKLALNLKSNQSEFSKRINRMIMQNKPITHHRMIVSVCLLLVFLLTSAFVGQRQPEDSKVNEIGKIVDQDQILSDTLRFTDKNKLLEKLRSMTPEERKGKIFYLNSQKIGLIVDAKNTLKKADQMMEEIHEELIKDGILNQGHQKITLMFQYSDLLQGEKILGTHYDKYKDIFNRYFPVYDSYATTRVFRLK